MPTKNSEFLMNELAAIYTALESQIEDCESFLSDSSVPLSEKCAVMDSLKYSKSALKKNSMLFFLRTHTILSKVDRQDTFQLFSLFALPLLLQFHYKGSNFFCRSVDYHFHVLSPSSCSSRIFVLQSPRREVILCLIQ